LPDWSGTQRGLLYRPIKQQLTLRSMPTSSPGSSNTPGPLRDTDGTLSFFKFGQTALAHWWWMPAF
jgi:hypothetical protein